jgi:alpha-mannosidase
MTNAATPSAQQVASSYSQISDAIKRLRQLNQLDVQARWRSYQGDLPVAQATQATNWQTWAPVSLNARNQIAWAKGRQVLWLGQRIGVPHNLQGYYLQGLSLRLGLTWWAQAAQIYVNGKLVQEGDLFDSSARIVLSTSVKVGDTIDVAIRLESPGHDDGALVRSLCLYELASQAVDPTPEPSFVADELAVLQEHLNAFAPASLTTVAAAVAKLPWSVLTVTDRASFDRALAALRQQLKPLAAPLKQRQIQLLGHAHLDMAWLWRVSETWQVAERTFRSVLQLQQEFPELTFCHTTPALYAWMEQNRPELLAAIQAQVAAGRWEVAVATLWIEPELNLVSGESIARQLLYGQHYLEKTFGKSGTIAWLPDSFGFCWQLPQLLKQAGIDYFVTQKLRWNDTTQFPYEAFWWRSPDGSQIFSLNSAPIGEGIDPVKMAHYATAWETKTGSRRALWLPGVGDHGGGPTRDMLQLARRWQQSPFFPQLSFTTAQTFLNQLQSQPASPSSPAASSATPASVPFPTWTDDLYLEFHRGCYTTHADQKWWNRRCEEALYEAELFASVATLRLGTPYPQTAIETAWKKALFNQFHDILPGSAIAPAYADANPEWETAAQTGWAIRDEALQSIARHIALPPPPKPDARAIVVFNSLSWSRSEVVTIALEASGFVGQACFWQICDLDGNAIAMQADVQTQNGKRYWQLSFLAETIPAIGYRCFWLCPSESGIPAAQPGAADLYVLENEWLRVVVDPATGNLSKVIDKVYKRELVSWGGNQLQAFRDGGQYWDAWNIDPKYAQSPLPAPQLLSVQVEARGTIATRIRVSRKIGQSTFNQTYVLQKGSPLLKIQTQVDWRERHVLVKSAFPLNIDAAYATCEIPYGAIQRPTRPKTDHEKAMWEVPALRWADVSDTASQNSYGFSLLSDGKHGYDSQPNQIRLTLLRGAEWPDPTADLGFHQFTYAIYPHNQGWQAAQTVRRGYELNQPLRVLMLDSPGLSQSSQAGSSPNSLPPVGQFFNWQSENLILSTFKRAEADSTQWLIRCYECHGKSETVSWNTCLDGTLLERSLNATSAQVTNLLEQPVSSSGVTSAASGYTLNPWTIATFAFKQAP